MSKGAVLISGAAGQIGLATVDRFLESGYEVAGIDLDPSVEALGRNRFRGKAADVTDPGSLAAALDEVVGDLQLKHVVGLAGGVVREEAGVLDADLGDAVEGFASSVSVNLTGQFTLVRAALGRLSRATGDRSITLCSSVNALGGYGVPAYSAAKAGLIGMTHALATPLGKQGIRVNVVAPGTTRTPILDGEDMQTEKPTFIERRAAETPLGRIGEPGDVAAVIEALADRMSYVTDQVIKVDGGHLLAEPLP